MVNKLTELEESLLEQGKRLIERINSILERWTIIDILSSKETEILLTGI